MFDSLDTRKQIYQFIKLLFPIMIYQMISYSSGMIGTFMVGNYSEIELAGVSMGINIWTPIFSVISTLVVAIIPIVSQLIGDGKEKTIPGKVRQFIYVALFISIMISILVYFSIDYIIDRIVLNDEIVEITKLFLKYQAFGLIPMTLYVTLRSFIDSLGLTRLSMIVMLVYVPINVLLSYIFIFGKFGAIEYGGVGLAISTNITYIFSLIIVIFLVIKHPKIKKYQIFKIEKLNIEVWYEIFKLGLPMALAALLETLVFSALSLMVSIFDTITIAAHQAALNFAGFLYALPMSISSALTIVVAYQVGAKNYNQADKYVKIGMCVSIGLATIVACLIYISRSIIPYLYGKDLNFLKLNSYLLLFVVCFVILDSFSACLVGVLRAYKQVFPTCLAQLIGYYLIGLPLAFYFLYKTKLGVQSLWIAWIIGLTIYAFCMIIYYLKVLKKNRL
ncbi:MULTISPECIES: MATE family efflux transporter [unclassified Gemella]|uniref:MATE family efflux transporter n=1 Tax=unclassified Gemella TaxID=2624949 RepID=UPI001073202C|nr:MULTISPECIES: MATE family efflux transporter [unclassified Gemella]MBF0710107.1 MATE family efflux transporter [Gemella sp. GL1.1]MBF0746186.1 MATE family efflux transporter [Gemella sp. 19428wG2_WT2a]NYS27451.1 MATE family efflux transporter [Gemella sp. GL1]TFU60471.1 MATE family efflux transporter [Gemella sp. WT2a]